MVIEDPLAPHRGRLLGLAYRMLGSRADAEDILQETYLRYREAAQVDNAEAWLVTVVMRQCIDRHRSARERREVYVGSWLPEPIVNEGELSPETAMELADDLSFALLLLLQRLSPVERAAFLLHDIFALSFAEVAAILGKTSAACRQLAVRARKAVREQRPGGSWSPADPGGILSAFREALASGELERIISILREDAVLIADGGGMRPTALNPIIGAERIARYFVGVRRKFSVGPKRIRWEAVSINRMPGMAVFLDGALEQTICIEAENARVSSIYVVRNPWKLEWIGREIDREGRQIARPGVETLQ